MILTQESNISNEINEIFLCTEMHTAGKNLHVADAVSTAPVREANADEMGNIENLYTYVTALMKGLSTTHNKIQEIKTLQDQKIILK